MWAPNTDTQPEQQEQGIPFGNLPLQEGSLGVAANSQLS
jgi:hypothetical protein